MKLKRLLEAQLRSVQKQLQVLDNARKRLKAVLMERTRVLDLVCHVNKASKSHEKSERSRKYLCIVSSMFFVGVAEKIVAALS